MKPIVLCILDGVGITDNIKGNAFKQAKKPNFDHLWNEYPHSLLEASGELVGLPEGQMGNSEVGHTNIGAGRIVYQPLELINTKIKDKTLFQNKNILEVINHTKENNSDIHIFGLLSDGGIHSHINHLIALTDMCKQNNVKNIYLHMFLDGRDTLPNVALKYLNQIKEKISNISNCHIATISGRFYSMDRDNNWDRIKKSYDVIVNGIGNLNSNYEEVINECYSNNIYDEFITPTLINKEGTLKENDGLILFNFRPDRVRELFKTITNEEFNEFDTKKFQNIKLVTMMPVSEEVICTNAFELQKLDNTLGEYLSKKGLKQLRIAETEKYAHVTYFFDGGVEKDIPGCERILIPSPKVKTYDLKPEMSAYEITDRLLTELDKEKHDVVILNYANGDMVGHTGNFDAAIKAVEVLDECIEKMFKKIEEKKGTLIIIADHGNCDYMLDEFDNIVTSHSTNKVPCIITNKQYKLSDGKLSDIAPTILSLLGLEIPSEMDGKVLINRDK